jgi:multicomponent Na+:H+ antiporter subunit G
MIVDMVADILTGILLILGAFLSFAAGVGLIRFPDAIARLHATTKPQILGLAFILLAIAVQERRISTILVLIFLLVFQMLTAPVSAHMIGRAGYRGGIIAPDSLLVDELGEAIDRANQEHGESPDGKDPSDPADQIR